ncbi:DNA topoisomerase [Muribaculum intestinale]|uniref:DNA topoisomerase n=1 Tax=Muribaculum intestinale TaxID=1796646 RepID=UPI00242CAEF6|nr:DNA topoisomerase [Muribaculum intestinale]
MILIICENILATKTVALSLGANTEAAYGIYTSDTVTVANIPPRFIRQTPLRELAEGEYPFMPDKFRMSVTMKELERQLKPLFREAGEVVFASDGGADAQARFFNICRHFRVGCPRSRMWLTRLSYGAIRGAFHFRESGRHLHRLAQTGLVSKGMDLMFTYNINQTFLHIGLPEYDFTRQEAIALDYVGDLTGRFDNYNGIPDGHSIRVNVNGGEGFESEAVWESEEDALAVADEIPVGETVSATLTVDETDRFNIRFHTLLTLQMDAFNNLGFMPAQTLRLAQSLYDKGLISSPLTRCSHLPEKLRGHIQTVFPDTPGYRWGENDATIDHHAIITLRAIDQELTEKEKQLYWLIFNRMKAVVEQQPSRKYATVEFKIGEAVFYRQWELTGEAYAVTDTGTFQTGVTIADAAVYPCDAPVAESNAFTDVMCALTSKAEYVDEMMHTNVPYTLETGDYGSALDSLIRKGLVTLDGDDVYLSPEGQYVYDEFAGREFAEMLLTWQFEANDLYQGDQSGRSVIEDFSGSLLCMIETIDPEAGE